MKKIILFLLLIISVVHSEARRGRNFDVYLMIGQSNMAGRGYLNESDTINNIDGVWILNVEGEPEPARVPFNLYSTIRKEAELQRMSPTYSFSQQMHAVTGRNILIVQNARGGSSIKSWQPEGDGKNCYLDSAIVRCQQALKYGQLRGICWHQGETDIVGGTAGKSYVTRFKAMAKELRNRLGVHDDVPIIVGEVGQWAWSKNALFEPDDTLVAKSAVSQGTNAISLFNDSTLSRLCREVPNCHKVCSDGLTRLIKESDPHFSREGQLELGNRYARQMRSLVGDAWIAPYRDNKQAAISFTYDDGLLEHYDLVAPELEKRGFRGSFWIIGNVIDTDITKNGRRMTWAQVKELHDRGHEMGGHTWSHPHLTRMKDTDSLKAEICTLLDDAFVEHGLPRPLTMAWPYNGCNDKCRELFETGRIGSRIRQVGHGENNNKVTPEKLRLWLDRTIQQRDWGVTMTHAVIDGYDRWFHPEWLWSFYDAVKARESEVWVGTFGEVMAYQREADATTIQMDRKRNKTIIHVACPLDPKVFAERLTLCIRGSWNDHIQVKQATHTLPYTISPDGLLLVNIDPFAGDVVIE